MKKIPNKNIKKEKKKKYAEKLVKINQEKYCKSNQKTLKQLKKKKKKIPTDPFGKGEFKKYIQMYFNKNNEYNIKNRLLRQNRLCKKVLSLL